jgi:hypothetical protein
VFIGASRTQFGIHLPMAKEIFPERQPVMLARNGVYPLGTLRHLAEDKSFAGMVLVDVDARGMHITKRDHMDKYLRYYDRVWSPNWRWHRQLLNHWQSSMAVARAELGAVASLVRWLEGGPSPWIPNYSLNTSRTAGLEIDQVSGPGLADNFARVMGEDLAQNPPPPPEQWLAALEEVCEWVRKIEARGGKVIFYEPPVSGRQESLAQEAYPRERYWDQFLAVYGLTGLNYRDIEALGKFFLPDDSHIRDEDRKAYTRLLLKAMQKRFYLK